VSGSGISWAICKSAPRSRQITMPPPHHSVLFQARCPSCRPTNSIKALKAMMQLNNKQTTGPLAEQISSAPSAFQNCRTERDPACLSSSMVTSSDEALTLRSCRWCICDAISAAWHAASHQLHCWPEKIHNSQQYPFNGPLSGTTWVSRYQKGKTNLDFTEARNNEWQWH